MFLDYHGKVILLKRQPSKKEGNTWGIPGGKIEKGESPLEAALRETWEETGIDLRNKKVKNIGVHFIRLPDLDFVFHMFRVVLSELPEIKLSSQEHSEGRWVTISEALSLPLLMGEIESFFHCKNILKRKR